jgi:hypothetical protein
MVKLNKEAEKPVKVNGIEYDLRNYDEQRLEEIYETCPHLRHLFVVIIEEVVETVVEFIEELAHDFFIHKPKDQTEEDFFNQTIKEVVTPKRKRK